MATILRGYGWECGQPMASSHDMSSAVATNAVAKTGSYSLGVSWSGDNQWIRFPIVGSPANPSISVWQKFNTNHYSGQAGYPRLQFVLTSGLFVDLRWNITTHTYDAYVNNVLAASGSIAVPDDWFHIQFYIVIDAAPPGGAGFIGVKINGHQSISYDGDTQPGAETGATYFRILQGTTSSYSNDYWDDLVIGTGGYLGDLRCPDIRPNADTAVDDWTPSAGGDNYAMVDEVSTTPATIDADYNKAGIDGDADELALGDFDGVTYVPVAVTAWCRAQQLAANGDSIKIGINSNGTVADTEHPLSNTMQYYFHTSDDNPDDAAEWEDADIDALLVRYEAVIV